MSTDQKPDWQPPLHDKTGVAVDGGKSGLPLNHRLRAEALVAAGKTSDPDGLITNELITDTAARLRAEAAAQATDAEPKSPAPPAPAKAPAPAAAAQKGE